MSQQKSRSAGIAAAVTLTGIVACASTSPTRPDHEAGTAAGPPPRIVALGDSLTSGYRLRPEEAYPAVVQRFLDESRLRFTVVNAGVSGDTSARGLRRLDEAIVGDNVRILVLALGANDGLRGVALEEIRQNLSEIIERAQARGIRVLLCGMETPPLNGFGYTLGFHSLFPQLAAKYELPLVPFMLTGVFGNPEAVQADGIHPSAHGARLIAENVWRYLQPMARAVTAS